MEKRYNLYNLEPEFRNFLIAGNVSPITLKNYLSDFRHFAGWLEFYNRSNKSTTQINSEVISQYRSYLVENKLPHKTINRRLSTVRKFCSFCISQGWMKENPAKKISNLKSQISNPQLKSESFETNKASKSLTHVILSEAKNPAKRKNIVLDNKKGFGIQYYIAFLIILIFIAALGAGIYNQFFVKQEKTLAFATTPTRAGRILSFQGRLTDSLGNPITTATNVTYNLYNVSSGGVALYTAGPCSTTPDSDGIFNTLIGGSGYSPTPPQAVCGTEVGSSIFTENADVYLGITVAADAEMTPRQQIANVGYALNAETLQGLPPGTAASNIPYINSQGNLLIATSNPGIRSQYASSTFTISSALSTVVQSAGAGEVILQATESGTLKFRTGGATDTENRLTIDNTGNTTITGDLNLTAPADLIFGTTTSLAETTAPTDSGAYLVGANDEFDNSTSTTVQGVLNDLDAAITTGGGSSMWSLASGVIYPTTVTNDLAIGGTTLAASMFGIDESAGNLYLGYDNSANPTLNFEATDADAGEFGFNTNDSFYFSNANVGIGTTGPDAKLDSLATTEQLRLTYTDGTVYSSHTVDSSGNLTIDNTGTKTIIADDLQINGGDILDSNGNESIRFGTTASAVNEATLTNAATGGIVTLAATGGDTDVALSIDSKGADALNLNGTATGDVNIAGGYGGTGCTVTNSNGNLSCNGIITGTFAGTLPWSSIIVPTANLSLAHAGYTTAFTFDSVTTADAFALSSSSLTTGTILDLSSTSTAGGASGLSKVLDITRSGTNTNASHTAYGLYSAVTNTGTTSTNVGGYFSASGATNNYGLIVGTGNVGIGTTEPGSKLQVDVGTTANSDNPITSQISGIKVYNPDTGGTYSDVGIIFGTGAGENAFVTGHRVGTGYTDLSLGANDVEAIRIKGITRNVGIGYIDPGTAKLAINGNVGIGDTGPDAFLEVLGTTEQLRLTHTDGTVDSRFTVDASGNLTIDNTGTKTIIADDLQINGGDILDSNGNESIRFGTTASAVNETTLTNAATGGVVTLAATGGDADVALSIDSKGADALNLNGTATGDILLGGGSGSTGCTLTNSTGEFTCTILTASSLKWNALTVPDGNLTLAMDADTTTFNWDTLTTGTGWTGASTSLSSGTLESLSVNSTAATGNTQKVLSLSTAGANATSTQTTYGLYSTNTHTGTASTNIGGYFSASGGTNNYAAIFENGSVGIGTTGPTALLQSYDSTGNVTALRGTTNASAQTVLLLERINSGTGSLGVDFSSGYTNLRSVNDLAFFYGSNSAGTEAMRIKSGNVGIGTTAPDAKMEINHATGDNLRLTYNDSDGSATNYTDFSLDATGGLTLTGSAASVASGVSAEKTFFTLTPATITLTGTTQVTSLMDTYLFSQATIAGDTATVTVDDAATLTIAGPPAEGTNVSLTEAYGLKINTAATTATTAYGLYVDAPTGAGSNYGAIFASGNVGIGDTSPASTLTVGNGDLFQVAGASGDITTAGDIYVNGNDIKSTGALTVTPNAGSSLSVALSTTGDFIVNTDDLFVDTSAGVVGINTAVPSATYKLTVNGDMQASTYYDLDGVTYYMNPAGASNLGGNITMVGDLTMTDGSPLINSNSGSYNTITIKGSTNTTTASVCIEGTGTGANCDGKLNVGTIDPPYTINGKKYATYFSAMTGVKEETTGTIDTTEKIAGLGYRAVVNFDQLSDDSDLWLFSKTTNLRSNIDKLIVLTTPKDNTRTWYLFDKEKFQLQFFSSKPTTISYRLTAPRFDYTDWSNKRLASDPVRGFLLNDQGNLNPADNTPPPAPNYSVTNEKEVVYRGNLEEFKNDNLLYKITGDLVEEIIAVNQGIFAKIKVGFAEIENIIVNGTIVSPVVETTDLVVSEIQPQNNDLIINLEKKQAPGQLAKLIIKGFEGKTVTTIDEYGNASFSGQIIADSLTVNNDATISGKLIAGQIESGNLNELSTNVASQSSAINDIQTLLADIKNQPAPDPVTQTDLSTTNTFDNLTVTNDANFYNATVSNSLITGNVLISNDNILGLSWDLNISSLANINFFGGAVTIAKDGTLTTTGQLIAQAGIRTNEIKGFTDADQVVINNLTINNLTISDKYLEATASGAIIAAADNFTQNGIFAPALETASTSAGIGILPENSSEVIIYNNTIKDNSLVYLTPTSSAAPISQLTVAEKSTETKPYFKVITNTPSTSPIKFNWLIIN